MEVDLWQLQRLGVATCLGVVACLVGTPDAWSQDAPGDEIGIRTYTFSDGTTEYRCGDARKVCGRVFVDSTDNLEKGCIIVGDPEDGYEEFPHMHPRTGAPSSDNVVGAHYLGSSTDIDDLADTCTGWASDMEVEWFEVLQELMAPMPRDNPSGWSGRAWYRSGTPPGDDDVVDMRYWYDSSDTPRRVWSCPGGLTQIHQQVDADIAGDPSTSFDTFSSNCSEAPAAHSVQPWAYVPAAREVTPTSAVQQLPILVGPLTYTFSQGSTEYHCGPKWLTCGLVLRRDSLFTKRERGCLINDIGSADPGAFASFPAIHPRADLSSGSPEDVRIVEVLSPNINSDHIREQCEDLDKTMSVEYFDVTFHIWKQAPSNKDQSGTLGQVLYESPSSSGNNDDTPDLYYWHQGGGLDRQSWACPGSGVDLKNQKRAKITGFTTATYREFETLCGPAKIKRYTLREWK